MKNILFLAVLALAFSCGKQKMEAVATDTEVNQSLLAKNRSLPTQPHVDLYDNGKTKLIKTAHYRFQVKSVKESTHAFQAAIRKFPAYISSSNLILENTTLENKITIRVQSEYFQDLLEEIDKQALFTNFRNIETDDVAKEFVDLESRLKTKREVEERYSHILRTKAGTIKELLEAEKQIGALHEEIEATVSRINYLNDQVSYSCINLEYYETAAETRVENGNAIGRQFAEALSTGLQGVINLGIALAYIWPLIIVTLLYLAYRNKKVFKIRS
jgi:hypothetical protein